jgi:hypothetical protein
VSSQAPAAAGSSRSNASLVLALGILGLVGGLGSCCCCAFLVLAACAPFAWVLGHRELAAIRAGRAPASGEGSAKAGMICGIIGSAMLALYLLGVLVYVGLVGFGAATELLKQGGVPLPR